MTALYLIILLLVFGASVLFLPSYRRKKAFLNIIIWLIIIFIIVFLYSFNANFKALKTSFENIILRSNLIAYLMPSYGYKADSKILVFKKANDGHFYINAQINSRAIKFLVDTGASDIIISSREAAKLGFDLKALTYNKVYNTANGLIYAAPIIIKKLTIKDIELYNIRASISSSLNSETNVLGMSFLEKFRFSIASDTLILQVVE